MSDVKSDIQIAREAKMQPINDILAKINVPDESAAFSPMGRHIAKINLEYLDTLKDKPDGKLILVTAITPTPAGEGKTTTSVGVHDGLNNIGKKSIVCFREPSLGPAFGMNGGGAGGGAVPVGGRPGRGARAAARVAGGPRAPVLPRLGLPLSPPLLRGPAGSRRAGDQLRGGIPTDVDAAVIEFVSAIAVHRHVLRGESLGGSLGHGQYDDPRRGRRKAAGQGARRGEHS